MDRVTVPVMRLPHYPPEWGMPAYATSGSVGVDLRNAGPAVVIPPLGRHLVPSGLAVALPAGMEAQVRPRSGLAFHRGVTIINTPGTIDSDYRGEILVPLVNLDREAQEIAHGERIAQLMLVAVRHIAWQETLELPSSERADGGFGSTGA